MLTAKNCIIFLSLNVLSGSSTLAFRLQPTTASAKSYFQPIETFHSFVDSLISQVKNVDPVTSLPTMPKRSRHLTSGRMEKAIEAMLMKKFPLDRLRSNKKIIIKYSYSS